MNSIVKVVAALSALQVLANFATANAWATADGSLNSSHTSAVDKHKKTTATPTGPPPKVTPGRIKEGTSVHAADRFPHRAHTSEEGKTQKASTEKKADPPRTRTDPPPTKEDPPTPSKERTDFKINIGVCGRMQPDGTVPGPTRCQPGGDGRRLTRRKLPPTVVLPKPEDITWEQVRSETKNVIFPGLSVKVQPNGRTLVNMATIVYTDDSKVSTATVTLLGFPVVVEATPISYTWDFGDGSPTVTTSTPGKPYPAAEITHKYLKRQGVGITVTTNYAARFNVANTGWQYVEGTVPITGPATLLQVREAVPVLVDPGR
jgi:hypothetical protein